MENQHLRQHIAMMKQSFYDEGFLSPTKFQQLEGLQDMGNPYFVQDIFGFFFEDTIRYFNKMDKNLFEEHGQHKDETDRLLHRLKGIAVSLGALKMLDNVNKMRESWEEDDMQGTIAAYKQLKIEQQNLKLKVEPYFQLLRHVGPFETTDHPK